MFPAGPPAAILLYTLAPTLLLGWPRANRPEECVYMLPDICARPEIGRITGRGNTANLETMIALKPELILDVGSTTATYVSLAERVQQQTGIPYALLDGRFLALSTAYEGLGNRSGARNDGADFADYCNMTLGVITNRIAFVPRERRPRVYYARGPRGLVTGLGGSINVETIELMAVNVAAGTQGGLANVLDSPGAAVELGRDRHHRSGFRRQRARRPGLGVGQGGARGPRALVAENAVRLGRFPALGQPVDRAVVAWGAFFIPICSMRTCAS